MSKQEQNKLVPKWRFPEFDGPWNYLEGDKLFEQISDKEHNSDLPILAITQEQGAIPRNLIDYHVSVTEKSVESYKVVQIGDFIISLRSFQGGIEYSEYVGLCSPAYIILRKKRIDEMVNDFYRHYFKSKTFIRDLNRNLEGIRDGKMVSYKQFSEIESPIPSPAEQQKIADCLSSLDQLIAAHSGLLEALKAHKKGMLQQLFPAEGETVPRLRFPEFQDSGDWGEKRLSEIAYYENGKAHEQDISETGKFIVVNSKFISTEGDVAKFTNTPFCMAKKGDVLMVLSDVPNGKAIGKCFYVDVDNRYTVNQRICRMSPNNADGLFLYYQLDRNNYFLSFDDGVKQTNLRKDEVLNCPLLMPIEQEEQRKIADCISSASLLIESKAEEVAQLKLHKKGLMQGLFPNFNDSDI